MKKKIIIGLIVIGGVFFFQMKGINKFYYSQFSFFILSAGIMASFLFYKKNKWIGYLLALCSFGVFKTFLLRQAPQYYLFESALMGIAIFTVYYVTRQLKLKEDVLKFFLIPAGLNILFLIIQRFDSNIIVFLNVDKVTGFLGGSGITTCYLALTTPIFLRYFSRGFVPLLLVILICVGITAFCACLISALFYLWYADRSAFRGCVFVSLIIIAIAVCFYQKDILLGLNMRLSIWMGTLDALKTNPILGWGTGSFEPTMKVMAKDALLFNNLQFNYEGAVMTHPHNEILLGWWNFGIIFPFLFFRYSWDLINQFRKQNILSFSIIIAGFICMTGYFLSSPSWFLLMMALGIYENQKEEKNGKKKQSSREEKRERSSKTSSNSQ